jgi:hypothetical protein
MPPFASRSLPKHLSEHINLSAEEERLSFVALPAGNQVQLPIF